MWTSSRRISAAVTAGYLLALVTAALVHNHGGQDGGCCGARLAAESAPHGHRLGHGHDAHRHGRPCPAAPAHDQTGKSDCAACHFLAQKLTLTAIVAPAASAALVQRVAAAVVEQPAGSIFSAWQSRAPPTLA
ncbi:MAG: hypothetical protein ABFC96_18215 [Thermoguttaceae bacterium]